MFEGLFARRRNGDRSAEATTASLKPANTRPTIGLALGGGAARGFAHIGVIQALEENGLAPDLVAMGFMSARAATIAGHDCFVTRSGYTGEDGFEISVAADSAVELAERLLAEPEVMPTGLLPLGRAYSSTSSVRDSTK